MQQSFFSSFFPIFVAILKIFLIALVAGLLVRRKVISQEIVNGLSRVTVLVFLPCLIFAKILKNFNPETMNFWWIIPVAGFAMIGIGLLFSSLLFYGNLSGKRSLLPLASIQNAAYLVLPIAESVYPENFDTITVYVFLIVLAVSPSLWSIGKYLSTDNPSGQKHSTLKSLINPPFIANILALVIVFTNLNDPFPGFLLESIDFLGGATVPVVTFILGATLGGISLREWPKIWDSLRVILVKFVLIPGGTLLAILVFNAYPENPILSEFLLIEASSAPATGHILLSRTFGGNVQQTGSIMLISYFVCLVTIPGWITLLRILT